MFFFTERKIEIQHCRESRTIQQIMEMLRNRDFSLLQNPFWKRKILHRLIIEIYRQKH